MGNAPNPQELLSRFPQWEEPLRRQLAILQVLDGPATGHVITLLQIHSISRGPEAYARFEERMRNPLMIALNAISFLFVLFHTITWFNLAPRAVVARLGGKRVPQILIAGSNYVAWLVISAAVAWFILR